MTRINPFRDLSSNKLFPAISFRNNPGIQSFLAWGRINLRSTASPLAFAAILIVCSFAAGCSSEKPRTNAASQFRTSQTPSPQVTPVSAAATPALQPATKPLANKVTRRRPATVTYIDKASGVSFQYPRKYRLQTGEGAAERVSAESGWINFVKPGGVALAVVTVPEGAYPKSDLASAFFSATVNRSLTAAECGKFSASPDRPSPAISQAIIGELELQVTETSTTEEARHEDSKLYHAFKNGACYEFALKVATRPSDGEEGARAVDRKQVFRALDSILATVKVDSTITTAKLPTEANSETAETSATLTQ